MQMNYERYLSKVNYIVNEILGENVELVKFNEIKEEYIEELCQSYCYGYWESNFKNKTTIEEILLHSMNYSKAYDRVALNYNDKERPRYNELEEEIAWLALIFDVKDLVNRTRKKLKAIDKQIAKIIG